MERYLISSFVVIKLIDGLRAQAETGLPLKLPLPAKDHVTTGESKQRTIRGRHYRHGHVSILRGYISHRGRLKPVRSFGRRLLHNGLIFLQDRSVGFRQGCRRRCRRRRRRGRRTPHLKLRRPYIWRHTYPNRRRRTRFKDSRIIRRRWRRRFGFGRRLTLRDILAKNLWSWLRCRRRRTRFKDSRIIRRRWRRRFGFGRRLTGRLENPTNRRRRGLSDRLRDSHRRRRGPLRRLPLSARDDLKATVWLFDDYFFSVNRNSRASRTGRRRLRNGRSAERRGWNAGLRFDFWFRDWRKSSTRNIRIPSVPVNGGYVAVAVVNRNGVTILRDVRAGRLAANFSFKCPRYRRLDFSWTSTSDSTNSSATSANDVTANHTSSQRVEILRKRLFIG